MALFLLLKRSTHGNGFIVPLGAFLSLIAMEFVTEAASSDTNYYQSHGWTRLVAMWLFAGGLFAFRSKLGVGQVRRYVDATTGKEVEVSTEGTFLWIPMRLWPPILAVAGVALSLS